MTEILAQIRFYRNNRNKYSFKEREAIRVELHKGLNKLGDHFVDLIDKMNKED